MKDILIHGDGTPVISGNDFVESTYAEYVAQKVYCGIMNLKPSDISGSDATKPDLVVRAVNSHFARYFANDPDVQVGGLKVSVTDRIGQDLSISIEYSGNAPDGQQISVAQGMGFNMAAGALTSIDFEPAWLRERDNTQEVTVSYYLTLTEPANRIELPVEPRVGTPNVSRTIPDTLVNGDMNESFPTAGIPTEGTTVYPIYVCPSDASGYPEMDEVSFSIAIESQTMLYPISRYIGSFIHGTHTIVGAVVDTIPNGCDIKMMDESGELSIFALSGTGILLGRAYISEARYATYNYIISDTMAREHVYKLRPVRGRYMAVFSRTVAPGTYMIQYKGRQDRRTY